MFVASSGQTGGIDWAWRCPNPAAILPPLAEALPATSHRPATQDLAGVDPGDHKWATMGMAPSSFSVSPKGACTYAWDSCKSIPCVGGEGSLSEEEYQARMVSSGSRLGDAVSFCLDQSCTVAHAVCNVWQSTCVSLSGWEDRCVPPRPAKRLHFCGHGINWSL